jgi:hypothetical protein
MRISGPRLQLTKLPVEGQRMKAMIVSALRRISTPPKNDILCLLVTNGGAIPFNTQFFHDDYDDGPGFDDPFDGDGVGVPDADAGEQDLLAATQGQTRRVRPEFVNYAKRAKRVDVRKLKENIWRGLNIVISPMNDADESMVGVLCFCHAIYLLIFFWDRMWTRTYLLRLTPKKREFLAQ